MIIYFETEQKTLYMEEMSKVKAKHEQELNEHNAEVQRYANKLSQFETRYEQSAAQLHNMNTRFLDMYKENEIMKSKLRNYENSATFQSLNPSSSGMPSNFMEKIRGETLYNRRSRPKLTLPVQAGSEFKMEDEEGELFDNTYLDHMQSGGRFSLSGRDSLTQEEIQRRNSMVPAHLRSSYMAQYQTQTDENVPQVFGCRPPTHRRSSNFFLF